MKNMGQVKGHPLADWGALARFRWPDPHDPAFYSGMEQRFAGSEGKYVMTGIFMLLFERLHALHGFESTLADLYLERERIEVLADRIVEFDLGIIEEIAHRFPGQIHGFSFTDDWGTQRNVFIKPALWDAFKPRYKRIFDAAHAAGWHVWMHSCGKVNAILESLIDIGLDVINLQQPRALGIEEIGSQFRGRICFESLCDIQHTLPFRDAGEFVPRRSCCSNAGERPRAVLFCRTTGMAARSGWPWIRNRSCWMLSYQPIPGVEVVHEQAVYPTAPIPGQPVR